MLKKINYKKLGLTLVFALLLTILFKNQASAAITNPVAGDLGQAEGAADGSKFIGYVVSLWRASITLGSMAVILFVVLGAIQWITSSGDSGKIEKARDNIINAFIGLVILVGSFVILGFLSKILFGDDFDLMQLTIPGVSTGTSSQNTNTSKGVTPSDEAKTNGYCRAREGAGTNCMGFTTQSSCTYNAKCEWVTQ